MGKRILVGLVATIVLATTIVTEADSQKIPRLGWLGAGAEGAAVGMHSGAI